MEIHAFEKISILVAAGCMCWHEISLSLFSPLLSQLPLFLRVAKTARGKLGASSIPAALIGCDDWTTQTNAEVPVPSHEEGLLPHVPIPVE